MALMETLTRRKEGERIGLRRHRHSTDADFRPRAQAAARRRVAWRATSLAAALVPPLSPREERRGGGEQHISN